MNLINVANIYPHTSGPDQNILGVLIHSKQHGVKHFNFRL